MLSSDPTRPDPQMTIRITPMNIGLFRLLNQLRHSMSMMTTQFGGAVQSSTPA